MLMYRPYEALTGAAAHPGNYRLMASARLAIASAAAIGED
jgi:hypothetical protein